MLIPQIYNLPQYAAQISTNLFLIVFYGLYPKPGPICAQCTFRAIYLLFNKRAAKRRPAQWIYLNVQHFKPTISHKF